MKNILFLLFLCWSNVTNAQVTTDLEKQILKQDSLLFSVGFNTCDLKQFELLLTSDFEFYHDKAGFSNRKQFLNDLRNGLCAHPESYQSRRALHSKSSKFYPLYQNDTLYAVLQTGRHAFYERIQNQEEQFGSTALFSHLWILENGEWKLKRVYSFDHRTKKRN